MDTDDWIEELRNNKESYQQKIKNIKNKDILRLRNEAAEQGVEMTPDEVYEYLKLMLEIASN
jgi:hypothetical protein